jgi:hypothetical protein
MSSSVLSLKAACDNARLLSCCMVVYRETVLSPSRVHMGEGMVVSNLRDSTGTKDLGIVVVKVCRSMPSSLVKACKAMSI